MQSGDVAALEKAIEAAKQVKGVDVAAAEKKLAELRAAAQKKAAEQQLSAAVQSGDVAALEKAIEAAKRVKGVDVAVAEKKLAELQPSAVPRPSDEAVRRLLRKVGMGSLEEAVGAKELQWYSKNLDAEDAKVVAYIVTTSGSLATLSLMVNKIGDAGANRICDRFGASVADVVALEVELRQRAAGADGAS